MCGVQKYEGVHDHIFVRVIVIDNGAMGAALVTVDAPDVVDTTPFRQRIEKATGIPAGNIFISATHITTLRTWGRPLLPMRTAAVPVPPLDSTPRVWRTHSLNAVRQVKAKLQPGKWCSPEAMPISTSHKRARGLRLRILG